MKLLTILMLSFCSLAAMAQGTDVSYKDGKTALKGFLAAPKMVKNNKAGIVVLPAWMGITKNEQEVAQRLSHMGYMVLVADIYGEDVRPADAAAAGKESGYYKAHRDIYRKRIQAAIDRLIEAGADKDHIAVIGYCFGGTGALEAARANMNLRGVVSLHGGLDKAKDTETGNIRPKVLVLHGADDPHVPKEQVDAFQAEMKAAKADWQMIFYADAVHGFTMKSSGNDKASGVAYNELAAHRSWEHMRLFLQEILR